MAAGLDGHYERRSFAVPKSIEQIDSWAWGKERLDMYLVVSNFDAEERGSNELELPHEVQNNPPIRPNRPYHCWRLVLTLGY